MSLMNIKMNINLLVQEFYAIEALSAMLVGTHGKYFEPMRHSHSRWYRDFNYFRNDFIVRFASAIYDYTALVVAAELRHGASRASHYIKGYFSNAQNREQVYHDCTVYRAEDILKAGIRLFDTDRVDWEAGYGGEKWKQIASAGLLKGKYSDCIFIDHCIDLSHNSNFYFDKNTGIFYLQNSSRYKSFLDLKRDCKPQVLISGTRGYAMCMLLRRASNLGIIEKKFLNELSLSEYDESESLLLTYSPINWGEKLLDSSDSNILERNRFCDENERDDDGDYEERCRYAKCA